MTPEARLSVPAGTPGKPGVPCSATSVPSSVVKPAPDNAETGVLEGVAQDGGTDIGPIEPARPALASTASCMLAAAPFSAELSAASIPNAPGANSAGFSLAAPKRPKLFSAPMMPAHIDSMSCVTPTVAYAANMPSRMVKSSGRMLGHPVGASTAYDRKEDSCDNAVGVFPAELVAAWVTAAFWAASPAGLVVCCGEENGVNCLAAAEVVA